MGRAKILIPEDELRRLYVTERLSPQKIGAQYGCDGVTVRTRLKEAGITLKSKSAAQTRYPRRSFDGSNAEKAYLLGFKYGDLNAYIPKGASETIVVRSHTTHEIQVRLFESLFEKYGKVTLSRNVRSIQTTCYLDMSFSFLLGKYPESIRRWLLSRERLLWAFTAGYIDAEGTFGLNQGRGRFKIDAYDADILADIHALFLRYGLRSKSRVIARKGENDYGWEWKEDVWRVSINEAQSLEKLVTLLLPHLRHAKRIEDAQIVLANIRKRRKNGTIN